MGPGLESALTRYFAAERRGGAVFLAVGLTALVASAGLGSYPTHYRGMVPVLVVAGLVQVGVGATVFLRTPRQVASLRRRLGADEDEARRGERIRMRRVASSFRIYKVVELALLTAGITLAMLFPRHHPVHAAGLGCVLEGSLMLILDRLAERRGEDYAAALERRD